MRFFGFGPQPIQSIFGRDIRAIAFGVAIFQIVIAGKLLLLALIALGIFGFSVLPYCLFFLIMGLQGLRCTRRRILERGLNVRLIDRLAVWSWLWGLLVVYYTPVLLAILLFYILFPFQIFLNMFLFALAGYVIFVFCAYVVWSYKETIYHKLPDNLFGSLEINLIGDNNNEEGQRLVPYGQLVDSSQPTIPAPTMEIVPIQNQNRLENLL
eukprot:TRINITY_DN15114_c0_g1_i2.p2 TRINITY_DN15114_c0_g1~~TRINITY_DN15114_c0_g1_i2.p2  ORF type:complete len:211 (+),score=0.14 TRINITY_DN15114_c0_g1_i2:188-820(+)